MGLPVVVGWLFTAAFLALAYPCLRRLARLDYVRLGSGVRHVDLAGLLMTVAMVAMVSPVGGPVPVAGWQALFLLTAGWFGVAAVRGRAGAGVCRRCDLHHGISAVAMLLMLAAMPHAGGHDLAMSAALGQWRGWPVIALLAAFYFLVDSVLAARGTLRAARAAGAAAMPEGFASRTVCRVAMGGGMAVLFVATM
ncbi:DUF5134 domain-containing protein [Prauserella marina]|uniref:Uncharacterized protein n=1 Tax=Prauserella marina TaxID=530584 RepID=A0A222VNB8_9PSEU|nr:DUF5134 domain-containing protein [Prauserella marina]ASR35426.1 DUF5134 domain-containing protein [Prauserella marina]PWV84766.1 uncharacterized protein DUF5134 [Prauserella marina]SDC13710.1 protein of unknown function [Prauserella marina]